MSDLHTSAQSRAHVRIVFLGPVAPHWDVVGDFGDRTVIEEFRTRALARLVLLPYTDPQFKRNRERIQRDGDGHRRIPHPCLGPFSSLALHRSAVQAQS